VPITSAEPSLPVSSLPHAASPLLTVELVIFSVRDGGLQVLLVRRAEPPCAGDWALPGGVLNPKDPDLEAAALRKLKEETGVEPPYLEQLQTVGDARRDPRGWSVAVVYFALIASEAVELKQGAGTSEVRWLPVRDGGVAEALAFDHGELLRAAVQRLRAKVEYTALPAHLLPEEFTLTELQRMYAVILGCRVDKSAFRRRIREAGVVELIPGRFRTGSNRPAQLYRVRPEARRYFFSRNLQGRSRRADAEGGAPFAPPSAQEEVGRGSAPSSPYVGEGRGGG
jgi:ADP-ribose pyrophosphatase YjhB (NUDIX family)